MFSHC
ncbi:hypothetical protein F383_18139 [Gossypium arboreum]